MSCDPEAAAERPRPDRCQLAGRALRPHAADAAGQVRLRGGDDQRRLAGRREHRRRAGAAVAPAADAVAVAARDPVLGLPGRQQQRLRAQPQPRPSQPARREAPLRGQAVVGVDADRALPHLQVGLGAAAEVADDPLAGDPAQVLDPVGVEAVVGDAVGVDVEDALAAALALEGDGAVIALERVADRPRPVAGPALGAEAVHVGPVAEAEVVRRLRCGRSSRHCSTKPFESPA